MINVKRWTICLVRSHKWDKIAYSPGEDDTRFFTRCHVCGYENHKGLYIIPTGPL